MRKNLLKSGRKIEAGANARKEKKRNNTRRLLNNAIKEKKGEIANRKINGVSG